MFEFMLGTHMLSHIDKTEIPLFVSFRQLRKRKHKKFTRINPICIDSGGFSELSLYSTWTISAKEYVEGLHHIRDTLELPIQWAAPQDWMVEAHILAKTGLSLLEHQKRTVKSVIELREMTDVHIIPVLQGQTLDDYFNHFEMYEVAGFDLRSEPVVGVGSVCRREASSEIEYIMKSLHKKGLKLHGFGVKIQGLKRYKDCLVSSDSLAWSYNARWEKPCSKCSERGVKNCANCLDYALKWQNKLLQKIE